MAAINVFVSAVSTDTISRNDLIDWVNSSLSLSYLKIENLCSGLAPSHTQVDYRKQAPPAPHGV